MVTTFFQKAYDLFLKSLLPFSKKHTTFLERSNLVVFIVFKCYFNVVKTPLKHCFNSTSFLENECSGKIYRSINI